MSSTPPNKSSRRGVRIGKFEIISHIATGGMGAVYRAYDTESKREVALKVLSQEVAVQKKLLERFRREAASASKLRHENIVAVYEWGEATGTHYLAMEYIQGIDLHEYLQRKTKLTPSRARDLILQATRALEHAHERGIVHRDIKPSNFLLAEKDGRRILKLADLGLARQTDEDQMRLTMEGTTVGTVDYMSPEQARDSNSADIRSDIYSLGCTFYHLLAGHPPFPEGSLTERIYKHVEAEPPDVRAMSPETTERLWLILKKMLAKRPRDRYQTPTELIAALEDPALGLGTVEKAAPADTEEGKPTAPAPRSDAIANMRDTETGLVDTKPLPGRTRKGSLESPSPEPGRPKPKSSSQRIRLRDPEEKVDKPRSSDKVEPPRSTASAEPQEEEDETDGGRSSWWLYVLLLVAAGLIAVVAYTLWHREPNPLTVDPNAKPTNTSTSARGDTARQTGATQTITPKPPETGRPPLFKPATPLDSVKLREEFEGQHLRSAPFPKSAAVLRVCRLPGIGITHTSLHDAIAAAADDTPTLIEIHDQGPLFEPSLPPFAKKKLLIRAGAGYRPLLAWDVLASDKALARRWFSFQNSEVTLENLELVVKWTTQQPEPALELFALRESTLVLRSCCVSQAGTAPQGVVLVHQSGANGVCLLDQTYVRGQDIAVIQADGAGQEVLIRDSLLVSRGTQPLVQIACSDQPASLRVVRSTLLAGQTLLRAQPLPDKEACALRCLVCDSLLAHGGSATDGALCALQGPARDLSWRCVNVLYTGWKQLLQAGPESVSDLTAWRKHWDYTDGDQLAAAPWPKSIADPEQSPGELFLSGSPVAAYGALSLAGPLGADPRRLPTGRTLWLGVTYERLHAAQIALPTADYVPTMAAALADVYAGERLTLDGKLDLGKHVQDQLAKRKPAAKIVLHLVGSGEVVTSPLRIVGADVVLHCIKPAAGGAPLTLLPNPATCTGKEALFDIMRGSLELYNVRMACPPTAPQTLPQRLIRVRGGKLLAYGCFLQGPLHALPEGYSCLLDVAGSGKEDFPHEVGLSACVLLSSKTVIRVQGSGLRLRLKQSLCYALGDVFAFELGKGTGSAGVLCTLENNTFACQRTLLELRSDATTPLQEPVLVQADSNVFLEPTATMPSEASLLRCANTALARGSLVWQGRRNVYDRKSLLAYTAGLSGPPQPQVYADSWSRLWGSSNEQQPLLLELPSVAGELAKRPLPLHVLALPPAVRAMLEPAPGANFELLGLPGMK